MVLNAVNQIAADCSTVLHARLTLCSPLAATAGTGSSLLPQQCAVANTPCCWSLRRKSDQNVALFPLMCIPVYAGLSLMRSCHPTSIFTNPKHLPARLGHLLLVVHLLVPQARAQALSLCPSPRQTCPQVSFPRSCFIVCICVGILSWPCCSYFLV